MIVMKFGGTSVGGSTEINNVCEIVKGRLGRDPIVVVSAVKGMTDKLIECAETGNEDCLNEITNTHEKIITELDVDKDILSEEFKELREVISSRKEPVSKEFFDKMMSFGERMSSKLVAAALNKKGIGSKAVIAYNIGFVTDDNFRDAEILKETYPNIKEKFDTEGYVPVVTGFLGKTQDGRVTTLGRGGSDYTATIIGAALGAEDVEIWTDVNGVKTTDPRIVPEAKTIDVLSFDEASELAVFGAKVLHPKTIIPAVDKEIPVRVLNTHEPENKGTTIVHKRDAVNKGKVKAMTAKKNIQIITVSSSRMLNASGFLQKLFKVFSENKASVDVIATSEVSVSATVDSSVDIEPIVTELENFSTVKINKDKAIICVVGEGLKNNSSIVAGAMFSCLGQKGINVDMISQGASEINISFVVDNEKADEVIRHLHNDCLGV